MEGSGYPVNAEHLFLKEKALVKVQQYFRATELQIFLLSKKRGGKGLLKAFKNNKNCLFNKCSFASPPTAHTILSRTIICLGFPMLNETSTKHKCENGLKTLQSLAHRARMVYSSTWKASINHHLHSVPTCTCDPRFGLHVILKMKGKRRCF